MDRRKFIVTGISAAAAGAALAADACSSNIGGSGILPPGPTPARVHRLTRAAVCRSGALAGLARAIKIS